MAKKLEFDLEDSEESDKNHPASKLFVREPEPRRRLRSIIKTPATKKTGVKRTKKVKEIKIVRASEVGTKAAYKALKRSDKDVLDYLKRKKGSDGICKASIPDIAKEAGVSERQVQVSTQRLIKAELLERVGYDLGNPDRQQRGTIYKVLM